MFACFPLIYFSEARRRSHLPRKLPRPTTPASNCTKMHSRRGLPGAGGAGEEQQEEPEDGTFRYHVWTIKQASPGHTAPSPYPYPYPYPSPHPNHTDDVVDDVERRCIAPPKMANGDPRHWSQAEGRSPALGETGRSK